MSEPGRNAELFEKAFHSLMDRHFEQAIDLFHRVLSKDPDHVQSYGKMALAYASLGKKTEASRSIQRALELDPEYEPAITNLQAISQMRDGEPLVPASFVK